MIKITQQIRWVALCSCSCYSKICLNEVRNVSKTANNVKMTFNEVFYESSIKRTNSKYLCTRGFNFNFNTGATIGATISEIRFSTRFHFIIFYRNIEQPARGKLVFGHWVCANMSVFIQFISIMSWLKCKLTVWPLWMNSLHFIYWIMNIINVSVKRFWLISFFFLSPPSPLSSSSKHAFIQLLIE